MAFRRTIPALLLLPFLAAACADAHGEPSPGGLMEEASPMSGPETVIDAGTEIRVRLAETVSTKSHDAGDPVRATIAQDVYGPDGVLILPFGSEVEGSVRVSSPSSGPEDDAVLGLAVERLELGGKSVPVVATMTMADIRGDSRDSTTRTVGKIAVGTAAGAVLGRVLGDDAGDALKGAAAGTVAGAIVAFTTRGGHAELPEGSVLVMRLDEPVLLNQPTR